MAGLGKAPDWLKSRAGPGQPLGKAPGWLLSKGGGGGVGGMADPGSSPEGAFNQEPPDEDLPGRFGLKNFTTNAAHMEREIQRRGFETRNLGGEDIRIRSKADGRWYRLDPSGWRGFKELGKDVADVLGGAGTLAGQAGGHVLGFLGGGAAAGPVGAFGGGVAGGATGAGLTDLVRTEVGKRAFGFEPTGKEQLGSAGRETAYGAAGELAAPLAKHVIRGAGKLLKAPFQAETKTAEWAGRTLDKIAARGVMGKKTGKVGPMVVPALDIVRKEVPQAVTRKGTSTTGKVLSTKYGLVWSPNDPRSIRTNTLILNPKPAAGLNKIFPGYFEPGKLSNERTRNIAVEDAIARYMKRGGGRTLQQAEIHFNKRMKPYAALFDKAFRQTMGPRGGVAERIYGQLFRRIGGQLGRYVGIAGPISLLLGNPSLGLKAAVGIRGAGLLGTVMEKGMGAFGRKRLPTTTLLRKLGLPDHYLGLQTAQKREDVRRWVEEKSRELRKKISP